MDDTITLSQWCALRDVIRDRSDIHEELRDLINRIDVRGDFSDKFKHLTNRLEKITDAQKKRIYNYIWDKEWIKLYEHFSELGIKFY